jgi:ATP-dependent DNA helicase RecG
MQDWSRDDVSRIKGVGPALREKLLRLGISNQQQMLFHLPLRYEDRTRVSAIGSLQTGQRALIEVEILSVGVSFRRRGRNGRVLLLKVADGSGMLTLRFFHFSAAQQALLQKGRWIRCFGEARRVMDSLEMIHPEFEIVDPQKPAPLEQVLTPVYPVTEGLHQARMRKLMGDLIARLEQEGLSETLPGDWLRSHHLPSVRDALLALHHPRDERDVTAIQAFTHPAQQRFVVEELAAHRISLLQKRQLIDSSICPDIRPDKGLQRRFCDELPFKLTNAQQRVVTELQEDFKRASPMMRLLQGDVGSGKTVVAALACLPVIASGFQCALMAPTEILAEQHFRNFRAWFKPLDIEVMLLTGSHKGKKRAHKEQQIAQGRVALVVGTHALFQQSVVFERLGFIVIDEQHRFGVEQRLALQQKAPEGMLPHRLVMTATPIPRTLAMSIYADLDYSQIDELPPQRTPVQTAIIARERRAELVERVRRACAQGQQVYWVCTLIEESEKLQCEAAELTFQSLQQQMVELRLGLVHGQMKAEQKDHEVTRFKDGQLDVLVATTVIEVGVDVPNASIMIIENPERLGLSQIHQLRGRVGRGQRQSHCLLLAGEQVSRQALERLEIIRANHDGFVISQKDLELRGAGEVLGTRQAGEAGFRIADLLRDQRWFGLAAELSALLMRDEYAQLRQRLVENWIGQRASYSQVG